MKRLLSTKWLTGLQGCAVVFLVLAHLAGLYYTYTTGQAIKAVDLNHERNIPTYYQTLALWFSSFLLVLVFIRARRTRTTFINHWMVLAVIFLLLGFDEVAMMHDSLSAPVRSMVSVPKSLHYAWVIPYAALVLVFVVSYLRFFMSFSARFKLLFFLSGFIFVFGALGMEVVGAARFVQFGRGDILHTVATTIEETLEMTGILLFNYTLLSYLDTEFAPAGQSPPAV